IIAIHRNGKRVPGKVGEMNLAGGDFLLLLAGDHSQNGTSHEKDLFFLSVPRKVTGEKAERIRNYRVLGFLSVLALVAGVVGLFPLFDVCLVILTALVFFGVLSLAEIR